MKAKGYNGASVNDIVEAAKVPKGSFYNYFESKEIFAADALAKAADQGLEASLKQLANKETPPLLRLEKYFANETNTCSESDFTIGCFLGNMCQEMADSSELIRDKLRQVLGEHTQLIADVLHEAQAKGQLSAEADTQCMAEFLFNAWEGALMRMKASKCRQPLDSFLQQLPQMFKQ